MNKKLFVALLCLVLVSCFAFAACDVSPEQLILDQLSEQFKNAKEANVSVTVRGNSEVVATELVKYDFVNGKKTTTKRVPNTDFASDSAWKETVETVNITPAGVAFNWKMDSFSTIALDNLTLKGTLSGEAIKENLGIEANQVRGDVSVAITVTGDLVQQAVEIVKVEISYVSANGNSVSMLVTIK